MSITATPCLVGVIYATLLAYPALAEPTGPNLIPAGSFDDIQPTYVPWAGVDASNNIHGLDGSQLMVDDTGQIAPAPFGPSVAVGDLNADGKTDIVLADSRGYFWYFPNIGTPQKPAFTQGEVIPTWLGEERVGGSLEGVDNVVPRIQLVDFEGTKKLDLVAGTYAGKLFRIPNLGSPETPLFKPTQNRDQLLVNTHKGGVLWCNYLAPFFTTAFNNNNLYDLVMGEGTYSANSIYLLHNTDANDHPMFDQAHLTKIIPGMGLEQLTPNVVDWNHDGKPDVICGDRTGYINLYLNNSTDPASPTFAPGVHVKVGGVEQMGRSITVTVCDLSNNHLPNLLIGRDDGTLVYALNGGTLGNPQFNAPATPLKGVLPPDYHYVSPTLWKKDGAWGVPYELVGVTNPQLEPGFSFPDTLKTARYALKFWVWPYKNIYFQRYYLPEENELTEHVIGCTPKITIKMNTKYNIHFWVLAPNGSVSNFKFNLHTFGLQKWVPPQVGSDAASGPKWTEVNYDFRIANDPDPTVTQWDYWFEFRFRGQNPFYVTDLKIQEQN